MVVRETKIQDRVWYCGYVSIPPTHPLYGKNHGEIDQVINVYGGVTFSCNAFDDEEIIEGDVWEKDGYIVTTLVLSPSPKEFKIPSGWWTIGFDTAHYNINDITGNDKKVEKEFAIYETIKLKSELELLWKKQF